MDINLRKVGNSFNTPTRFYKCDSASDMNSINAMAGDQCFVINDGKTYIMNFAGSWKEIVNSGGGGVSVANGYYYNGNFYSDEEHTQQITPQQGGLYNDTTMTELYIYNGSGYVKLSIDTNVTQDSNNLVTSDAVYDAIYGAIGGAY